MTRPLSLLLSLSMLFFAACSDDAEPVADSSVAADMAATDKSLSVDTSADTAVATDKGPIIDHTGVDITVSKDSAGAFTLTSTAFADKQPIPKKHTCDGTDVSPALKWGGAPAGAKAFAIIVDDPDAPGGTFIHWLAYDLEPTLTGLSEGLAKTAMISNVGKQGLTGFGKVGYYGPCPPSGKVHNYKFMLHALSQKLGLMAGATAAQVQAAVAKYSIGQVTLTGTYKR
jgi:Raf kinase inhibitor-like YbhB/YbcL family protein